MAIGSKVQSMAASKGSASAEPPLPQRGNPARVRSPSYSAQDFSPASERLVALREAEPQHFLVARLGVEDRHADRADTMFAREPHREIGVALVAHGLVAHALEEAAPAG